MISMTREKESQFIPTQRAQDRRERDRVQGNYLFSTLVHNLPSQETSQILLHGRQSKLLSFMVFLSVPKGKILL